MKVAEVYYTGSTQRYSRRGPSDKRYNFQHTTSDVDDIPAVVENVEDALHFDDRPNFRVEWTPMGRVVKATEGPVSETEAALGQMGYRQKQRIAKSLGIRADGSEDELNDRIAPEVEKLKEQMEAEA